MLSIRRIAAAAAVAPAPAAAAWRAPPPAAAAAWYPPTPRAKPPKALAPPDARDGAPPRVVVPATPHTRIVEVPQAGFEWGDAAIGGAATLALVLLLAGVGMTIRPRRTAAPSN